MNGNKETKETIDSVRMLAEAAEGKDIMTLKIARKRPFKQSTGLRNFAHSTKL